MKLQRFFCYYVSSNTTTFMARRSRFGNDNDLPKTKITKESLKQSAKIFSYVLPYKWYLSVGLIFLTGTSLMAMVFPYITGRLVDAATGSLEGWNRNEIALGLIGILLIQGVFSFVRIQLFAVVSERAMRDVRVALYSKMIDLPIPFFEKSRVGELTSRITNDVTQLQDTLSITLAEFIRQVLILIIGIGIIFVTSAELTVVMISSFPVLIIGAIIFGKFIRKLAKKTQDELAQANVVAEETFQNIHTVKSFVNEDYEVNRYRNAMQKVVGNALKAARFRGFFASFVIMAIFGGIVLVLWYGLGLVAEQAMTIGDLVAFIIYTTFVGAAVGSMGELYAQLQKTIGASERIVQILEEKGEKEQPTQTTKSPEQGEIVFQNVVFHYPTRPDVTVLKGISFTVQKGQKVALVGHSGARKSTITQLLLHYYPYQSGKITIDGLAIQDYSVQALRSKIAVVPQEVLLFGGTIRENIRYGKPDATENEIIEAAKKAYAWDFIQQFPDGLDTVVGERGVKLSGGQRQRIAIARAILKNPVMLILDEATSSLDAESESVVQKALEDLMQNRTTLIIAHRLSTIRNCDKIYVLENGQIVEQGTHQQLLMYEKGIYKNMHEIQLSNS